MTSQDLKNSILQLAVQGKLVPQDPSDEPASELLKRIYAEKAKLITEGKIKKGKSLPTITDEEKPFDIPDTWEWVYFEHIGIFRSGYTPKPSQLNSMGKTPYFKISDMNKCGNEKFLIHTENFLSSSNEKTYPACSIVYPKNGGAVYTNKRRILSVDSVVDLNTGVFSPYDTTILPYIYTVFNNIDFKRYSIASPLPTLDMSAIKRIMIPLPPLAEQERIVAKIEELMPLVEEYGKTEERIKALNAEFPDKLRKSILQQAVQGKLTARDPSDEPASELLKRIRAEKAKLIAEGKIKKEKPLPAITDEEKPFDIPDTWEWVRLGNLVRYQGGYAYKSDTYVACSNNQVIRLGNVKNNKLLLDAAPVFVSDHIAFETEEYRIKPDVILFTMTGTKGKRDYFYTCCTTENNMGSKKLYLNQRVGCLKSDSDICLEWLVIFLQSELVLLQIFATATGNVNQANIGSNSTLNLVLPLPPLAEQKRIVARVEELLAACDGLK